MNLLDVDGHRLTVYVYDPVTTRYVDKKKAIAIVRAMRLVADPADPAHWTSSPF